MGKWPLMDGFSHLEDQWPGLLMDGLYKCFLCLYAFVMYGGELGGIE